MSCQSVKWATCRVQGHTRIRFLDPPDQAKAHFVRWELFQAHVLFRHFYWYHNNLWLDELPDRCVVMLSGKDDILAPQLVRKHLEGYLQRHADADLQLLYYEEFPHGGFLANRSAQDEILSLL